MFGNVQFGEVDHWVLVVYPDAGEAGGSWQVPRKRRKRTEKPSSEHEEEPEDPWEELQRPTEGMAEPLGAWQSRSALEAARRARAQVRRYCASNRLNRLGTLTYAGEGCRDMVVVREHIGEFFRVLRDSLGGDAFPYLWTTEWHKTHGLHVHFAVGQYIPRRLISETWGHGFVHIKLLGDLPVGTGKLGEARRAAGYLSKYVGKNIDDARRIQGLHRYDVAQGFAPRKERFHGRQWSDVVDQAVERMGAGPVRMWRSDDEPGWDGPPAGWLQWAG
ncbi:MAG: hypothetical protein AB7L13_08160 [Acidimicrobiia bacterium]